MQKVRAASRRSGNCGADAFKVDRQISVRRAPPIAIQKAAIRQTLQADQQNVARNAETQEYGEFPAATGCSGRTCHSVCLGGSQPVDNS